VTATVRPRLLDVIAAFFAAGREAGSRSGLPGSVRPDGTPDAVTGLSAARRPRSAARTCQRTTDSRIGR
jgi:hypothetical protein